MVPEANTLVLSNKTIELNGLEKNLICVVKEHMSVPAIIVNKEYFEFNKFDVGPNSAFAYANFICKGLNTYIASNLTENDIFAEIKSCAIDSKEHINFIYFCIHIVGSFNCRVRNKLDATVKYILDKTIKTKDDFFSIKNIPVNSLTNDDVTCLNETIKNFIQKHSNKDINNKFSVGTGFDEDQQMPAASYIEYEDESVLPNDISGIAVPNGFIETDNEIFLLVFEDNSTKKYNKRIFNVTDSKHFETLIKARIDKKLVSFNAHKTSRIGMPDKFELRQLLIIDDDEIFNLKQNNL